jgi:hypothetical protein
MLPLRNELFWDIEYEKLDIGLHKRLIIERVLSLGNLEEFFFLLNQFETKALINEIKQIGYLDPKTISFVVSFFKIDKKELRCFTKKQLMETHWS